MTTGNIGTRRPQDVPTESPLPLWARLSHLMSLPRHRGFLHAEPRRTRRFEILVGATGRSPVSLSRRDSSHQSGPSPARATCRSPLHESSLPPRLRVNIPGRRAKTTRWETAKAHMQLPCALCEAITGFAVVCWTIETRAIHGGRVVGCLIHNTSAVIDQGH